MAQLANCKASTRSNSRSLLDTSVSPSLRAWAAMCGCCRNAWPLWGHREGLQGLALGLVLAGTRLHEVVWHLRAVEKEAVPGLAERRDDALTTARPHVNALDVVRQAQFGWESDGLAAVVGENGGGGHKKVPLA